MVVKPESHSTPQTDCSMSSSPAVYLIPMLQDISLLTDQRAPVFDAKKRDLKRYAA